MSLFAGDLFNLEGAVALVTGGGTGIGLMAAKALAANGAKVYITGRRAGVLEEAIKAHGAHLKGSLVAVQADVSSKADLKRVLGEIKEGVLHILVKCVFLGPRRLASCHQLNGYPHTKTAMQESKAR